MRKSAALNQVLLAVLLTCFTYPAWAGADAVVAEPEKSAADTALEQDAATYQIPDREDEVKDDDEDRSRKRFDAIFKLGVETDDNVLNLRDDSIDEFEFDTEAGTERFGIGSIDDTIYRPQIHLAWSTRPASRKTFKLGARATLFQHQENTIRDHERYQLYVQKDLTDTREDYRRLELQAEDLDRKTFKTRRRWMTTNRSRLRFSYYRVDQRYSGERIDDDSPDQVDFNEPIRRSAFYDEEAYEAFYQQRLNRGERNRWGLELRYIFQDRDYNAIFNERDSDADRYSVGLVLNRLQESYYWTLRGRIGFRDLQSNTSEIGRSNSVGRTITDDLSYELQSVRFDLAFNWFRGRGGTPLRKANRIRFIANWGEKEHSSELQADLSHFGRDDDFFQFRIDYSHPILDDFGISLWAQHAQSATDFAELPNRPRAVSDLDDLVIGFAFDIYTAWRN